MARWSEMPRAQKAAIIAGSDDFRAWVAQRYGHPNGHRVSAFAATDFIKTECRIESRKELDRDAAAADRFDALQTEFDEWRGAIPARR